MIKVIKTLMTLRGVSQSDLSKDTGISNTAISRFLNGTTELRADSLVKVLQRLGADVDGLIKKEINKALGIHDEGSIGVDIFTVVNCLDPIEKRTLIDGMIVMASKNNAPEVRSSLLRLRQYRSAIATVRRMTC